MKQPPFRGPLDKLITCWCEWCVDHKRVVPLSQWVGYTHDGKTLDIIVDAFRDHELVKSK